MPGLKLFHQRRFESGRVGSLSSFYVNFFYLRNLHKLDLSLGILKIFDLFDPQILLNDS